MLIECGQVFCIYNEGGRCHVESISLDDLGICGAMQFPDIPEAVLRFYRRAQLERFQSYGNDSILPDD